MGATGTATLNFGSAPGTNHVTVDVTGQGSILSTSHAEAFMMGNDSTADHNTYEHMMTPMKLSCSAVVAGTGFTINSITDLRLSGQFKVRWVWSD